MKARLALLLIFLTTMAMAGTLYYVMKHSTQFQSESAHKMRDLWVQSIKPEPLGPFTVGSESVVLLLPTEESAWNFDLQGETLVVQPSKVDFLPAPGTQNAPSSQARLDAWKQAEAQIKAQIANTLKLEKNADSIRIQAPVNL